MGRALDGVDHGREAAGLNTNDAQAGLDGARRRGDATDQATAAHGNDQGVQVGLLAQHLQCDGALAGDHGFVVEGVDEAQALVCRHQQGLLARFVKAVTVQHHFSAKAACAFHLHRGRGARHHDHRAQAQALRVVRHALRVVAGGRGDHAADGHTRFDQRGQLVERAALLEGRGELQVLELQEDLGGQDLAQGARFDTGRVQHLAGQAAGGRFDVFEADARHHAVPPTVRRSMRRVG